MRPDYAILNAQAVRSAMKEFDKLKLDGVKEHYGFDDSKKYYVADPAKPERRYPPKAILGIAFKFSARKKPLRWNEFFGGEGDTNRPLQRLGFEIGEKPVLTDGYFDSDIKKFPDRNKDVVEMLAIKIRRGQQAFRKKLLKLYRGQCAISGCKVLSLLEAAHVQAYSRRGTYALNNGFILRTDLHTLFDVGLLSIDPNRWVVRMDAAVKDKEYRKFHGKPLYRPAYKRHQLSKNALQKRQALA